MVDPMNNLKDVYKCHILTLYASHYKSEHESKELQCIYMGVCVYVRLYMEL